ncbi:heme exporter protein CcmD [Dongia soli]|uniref:Heme exporter protein D n=1 Tax=Dongia soli TaxID=600628 RepID=A0ABU5E6E6_9PROT|nr:heme exporter protein CcmD [Dongia soli]MDY0881878.1 heme exporter protein CcmD [Dongia soli]
MEALSTFFAMGGYAAYVWPAYGVAAIILIAFTIDSWRRVRMAVANLRRLETANMSVKSRSSAPQPARTGTPANGGSDELAGP